jgi:glycerol-3-phosphate acyltransferase PlsX
MGDAYAKCIFDIDSPKVGLLSIGEEDAKGNELTKEALKLLKDADVNFIGNIEGKDIFEGEADVVVCDGFVGNITLKVSEGLAETLSKMLKKEMMEKASGKIDPSLLKEAFKNFKLRTDYSEYGGAPLLGISKPCIISHGRSSSKAIKNAIKVAGTFQSKGVIDVISREINQGLNGRETIAVEK